MAAKLFPPSKHNVFSNCHLISYKSLCYFMFNGFLYATMNYCFSNQNFYALYGRAFMWIKKFNMAANNSKKSADADTKLTVVLRHNSCGYSDYKNIRS